VDLHLDLDAAPGRTLRARAEHALREAVRSGRLAPGSRLPATRALAVQLGVSRGVVVEAYAQLAAEGYLDTRRGGGTRVAQHPAPAGGAAVGGFAGAAAGGAMAGGVAGGAAGGGASAGSVAGSGAISGGGAGSGAVADGATGRGTASGATGRGTASGATGRGTASGATGRRTASAATGGGSASAAAGGGSAGGAMADGARGATSAAPGGFARAALEAVPRHDLRPALPAVDGFPRQAWLGAITRVLRTIPDQRLGYGDRNGEPELRAALAASLARTRGVRATEDQVVVTGGLRDSLPLLWRLLKQRGAKRVGIEDPGWWRIGRSLTEAGLEPVPIPTDDEGLDPAKLQSLKIDAVAVTPAHQFPTGAVLAPARRAALVAWARERGAIILEDDYDAEFRYDRQPIGSLQGLAPDLVVYGGSASKTLAPALRLGWLVLPSTLVAQLHADDPSSPAGTPPTIDQLALADLFDRGEVDRHLRRQRHRYRRRRDALLEAIQEQLPQLDVRGAAAGLFAVLLLPPHADELAVTEAAARHGVALEPLRARGRPGLVAGYANLPEAGASAAVSALARAVQETVRAPTDPST
jgi:GntR family transcriptional regulator/MocR family aminotransferase